MREASRLHRTISIAIQSGTRDHLNTFLENFVFATREDLFTVLSSNENGHKEGFRNMCEKLTVDDVFTVNLLGGMCSMSVGSELYFIISNMYDQAVAKLRPSDNILWAVYNTIGDQYAKSMDIQVPTWECLTDPIQPLTLPIGLSKGLLCAITIYRLMNASSSMQLVG